MNSSATRSGLVALALVLGAAGASAQEGAREADLAAEVAGTLRSLGAEEPPANTARALVAHGPGCAPILLELCETGSLPDLQAEPLSVRQRTAVDLALTGLGRPVVLAAVEARFSPEASSARRRALLDGLGAVARGHDLALLLHVSATPPEAIRNDTALARSLEEACVRALERSPGMPVDLDSLLWEAPPEALGALVRAVAEVGDPGCVYALTGQLGMEASMDLIVLPNLARAARRAPRPIEEFALEKVRRQLVGKDSARACAAAYALGAMDDGAAAAAFVDMLDSPDLRVREAGFWALGRVTGLPWGEDPARWSSWLEAELEWRELRTEALRVALEGSHPAPATAALSELLEHRLDRHGLAGLALLALDHVEPGVRVQACRALQQLGSDLALAPLVESLRDPVPPVASAAGGALRLLTGLDLPPDYDEWSRALDAGASIVGAAR